MIVQFVSISRTIDLFSVTPGFGGSYHNAIIDIVFAIDIDLNGQRFELRQSLKHIVDIVAFIRVERYSQMLKS